ncbi:MAG TPA: phage terminase large subunit [Tepidisphaeraceae bacterium]|nr:phage terminase large subunit [Tepidisphaeraceae bacterium]
MLYNREKLAEGYSELPRGLNEPSLALLEFIQNAWPVVEPRTPFVPGKHLEAICEHLEAVTHGHIRNLLINIPPRHMKSLAVCVFWPAWEWTFEPQRRWLFSSYVLSLSTRDSARCRRLIESDWYRKLYGDRFQLRADQNAKDRFENDHGGCRLATSVGGAATGEGGDRVVVDDPHNVVERDSNLMREMALAWWDQTMSTRLNDPKTGAKVIVMQRIHEKDLSGHVLEQGGYEHLCLPAEFEPDRKCITSIKWSDWRTKEGECLWPVRIGPRELADLKLRLGPSGYAGQFQQRPAPAGGSRFQSSWFRYYQIEPREAMVDEKIMYRLMRPGAEDQLVLADSCNRFAVMDPAGAEAGDGNHPCYTVIQVWDITKAHDMLLVYQFRKQVQTPDAAAEAVRICREMNCSHIAIEKDGIGLGIVQAVRRQGVTVHAIKARGSKEARSQTAEIRMAAGQIFFPRQASFLFELEDELLHFPNSQYADQVDALSHAAIAVQKMGGGEEEREDKDEPREETSDSGFADEEDA